MKIGIGLPNQVRDVRPTVIPEWAAASERAGFSTLGTVGRVAYPGVMDTVTLAAAAAVTSTIGLVSNVLVAPVWPAALLAKEAAGIDGVSGGRLTLGVGVGIRPDDFVADGHGPAARGKRFDRDLEIYREVWGGQPIGGGTNPAVTSGSRQIPLLFGAVAPAAFERMARWGEGYIGASFPPEMVAGAFDSARDAWRKAGREGSPRLVAITYFALGDAEAGRKNVYDYYSIAGDEIASMVASGVRSTAEAVKEAVTAFGDLGADELIFNPATDDLNEVSRLAEIVL
ncbi:MAG TPA: LLM class flavin-dependent oxidoreductase [Trebonia sp.]|jgi:alkanesulfonate monooxygenase SsuD/methylene tetrahydromethanopterin reductase-like flavin-dependent oxidoreductase (luciferase family)|nr:LLM class flavin-dependent oxidoreductase [Trebonia sp.]